MHGRVIYDHIKHALQSRIGLPTCIGTLQVFLILYPFFEGACSTVGLYLSAAQLRKTQGAQSEQLHFRKLGSLICSNLTACIVPIFRLNGFHMDCL